RGPADMAQPSFEHVFHALSQAPPEKLLSLKLKLQHSVPGPHGKVLQAMVLLTLGKETDARICLDAVRDNRAAQYIQRLKLGAAGVPGDGEDSQPPQLDAGAVALLAQLYTVLAQEQLCSAEARDRACQAAARGGHASKDPWQGTAHSVPGTEQGTPRSAGGSGHSSGLFPGTASPQRVLSSSPVPVGGNSDLSGPRTLCSEGSFSLSGSLEISASPTAAFDSQPCEEPESRGPQECSWAGTASRAPGQDTAARGPGPEAAPQPCRRTPLPVPETPLPPEPAESSDVPSAAPTPRETRAENGVPTTVPGPGAALGAAPAPVSVEDSYIPAGFPCNSASISTSSHPSPPPYSFSSTLPLPEESHSKQIHAPPLCPCPSPAGPPASPAVHPSEPDGAEFFTFVVLHASEDELVAQQVKNLLESMGVSNGATLSEDFSIPGRSHMTCFQDAMENSAFLILLLTKNFLCNLCLFQTDTALMQSILDPRKRNSVIPFLPKADALEHSQMPTMLSGLVTLRESSPLFSKKVHKTFDPRKIREKQALWEQTQRRKLQARWEQQRAQQSLAALSLGSPPRAPPAR
ncbi:TCAM1 protein, partial [Spelaeornis formosus]|nr:TCAM1 protein [Elachura formosa]